MGGGPGEGRCGPYIAGREISFTQIVCMYVCMYTLMYVCQHKDVSTMYVYVCIYGRIIVTYIHETNTYIHPDLFLPTPRPSRISMVIARETTSLEARSFAEGA